MASRIFSRATARQVAVGGTSIGAAGFALSRLNPAIRSDSELSQTKAEAEFNTSYGYAPDGTAGSQKIKVPSGYEGDVFKIKNNYPGMRGVAAEKAPIALPTPGSGVVTDPTDEMPWMKVDFKTQPELYCQVVKDYCFEGNVNNDFRVERNTVRDWYHAPWMHWSDHGREPIHGLTWERPTKPKEFAESQKNWLQTWACGFYNRAGATAFGQIWKDPNNPDWKPFKFPKGTAVFKVLMTNATDEDLSFMKGAPEMQAVIAKQPDRRQPVQDTGDRNDFVSTLRLLQVDFAVQDDRTDVGWVFGTFMYDGNQTARNGWDRIIPVGLMWGNDPNFNQEQFEKGSKLQECWINDKAEAIRVDLKGSRKFWGWNGRLNGPADNFKSACISCHSTADWGGRSSQTFPSGTKDDNIIMRWFRNLDRGEPFDKGALPADYSLQLSMGYANYVKWKNTSPGVFRRLALVVPGTPQNREDKIADDKRLPLRDV